MASEIETFGLAALEAMAAGVPVVAVRGGSLADLVEDRVSGFLAAPGDVNGLAERLLIVLQQPEQASAVREAGLALAGRYSIAAALDGHEQFYQWVLEDHSAGKGNT
jgi:glycosyltransferase involved in cell wall biosynthesis